MVDGMASSAGHLTLDSRRNHAISASLNGKLLGDCLIGTEIQAKYVVGDALLGFWPIIIDAVTADWFVLDRTRCDFK